MKQIILIFTLLFSSQAFANRIYLDNSFQKTSKSKAIYYREVKNTIDKNYFIKDYTITGTLIREGFFKDKKSRIKHGVIKEYYSWGNIAYISNYQNNILEGKRTSYYSSGEIKRIEYFDKGELISGECYDKKKNKIEFFPSILMPKFDSKEKDIEQFIAENIIYPLEAIQQQKEGTVLVTFKVKATGEVSNIQILKSSNILFNKAAKQLISKTNKKWQSGKYENVPSDVTMTLPLTFTLK